MFDQTNNISALQQALFKAAQVGNVKLMREFIAIGGNPFILDSNDRNALSYAIATNPSEAGTLIDDLF